MFIGELPSIAQQDPQFSQYMFNSLSINPGFAGSNDMINLIAVSRQQWVGLPGRPKTTVFGADAAISLFGMESGVGINFMNDQLGFLNNITATLSYSSKFYLKQGTLGVGLSVGFYNQVLDPTKGNSGSGEDNTQGGWNPGDSPYHTKEDNLLISSKVSGSTADFGFGAYYKSDLYYIGISATHLFNPTPKFDDDYYYYLIRTYYFTGGYRFAMKDRPIVFHPSLLIKTDGVSLQTDANIFAVYKKRYWGGLSYRLQDAIVLLGGIELKSGLKIGYSYDIPVSGFAANFKGGHEVVIGYSFDMSFEKKHKRYKSVRYL